MLFGGRLNRFLFYCISMTLMFIIPFFLAVVGRHDQRFYPFLLIIGFVSIVAGVVLALKKLR
jgi:ethanolamine transporter EutH